MEGYYIRLNTDGTQVVTPTEKSPDLDMMKSRIDGGYLELVPYFTLFEYEGELRRCVAFCDENGKMKNFNMNRRATTLWDRCLKQQGMPGLIRHGALQDFLVGPILIVFGDKEFMEAL